MSFRIIIPARYGSTRLAGKPLTLIAGKPLIHHVYDCTRGSAAQEVVIATDDSRIAAVANDLGATVCMTSNQHQSGTERLAEVLTQLAWPDDTCVVNLQGDEPCMPTILLDQVARCLTTHSDAVMATLATTIVDWETIFDPNVVKVVTDAAGYALYFSRAPIPWHRTAFQTICGGCHTSIHYNTPKNSLSLIPKMEAWGVHTSPDALGIRRHIGLYAYTAGFIKSYVQQPIAPIEFAESLEQLRILWHGQRIYVEQAIQSPGPGVDVPEDIPKVEAILSTRRTMT